VRDEIADEAPPGKSGGASSWQAGALTATRKRFLGNVLIAVGALLPGIGGAATRFGHTEVLYVTELIGLVGIYAGYRLATSKAVGDRGEHPARLAPAISVEWLVFCGS
jgi:hypothetical protein